MPIPFDELGSMPFFLAVARVWRDAWPLLASGLAAGFVDAVGGGGGLITVPAFLAAGVPNAFLLGTNKGMSVFGTSVAVIRYARAGLLPRLPPRHAAALALSAMLCGTGGAILASSPEITGRLHLLVPVMLVAVMAFLGKRWFWDEQEERGGADHDLESASAKAVTGVVGAYDGLFGPGAGAFYLSYLERAGLGTVPANAVTKVLNLASNLGALACFAARGKVLWPVSVATSAAYMAGNYLGSGFVLSRGQSLVRGTVMAMTSLMLAKYVWQHW